MGWRGGKPIGGGGWRWRSVPGDEWSLAFWSAGNLQEGACGWDFKEECRIASAVCCVRGIGGVVEMQIRICWCVFDVAISGGVMVQAVRGGMMK
jgi:hypothetical protein